ncbi:alpha,alpha-trehalose-phosphate synthase [Crepidotus variabilis]|uniref:Alpha,alpha-trehalose-phosphate synthase n=1 Tax=Crepidotus variabilis TaxID=179855 RepID=A0A9P6JIZ8_9AGAR|nr:alpha,alpha-trehalose-phosphate synthase [Crepidotus variabilis]
MSSFRNHRIVIASLFLPTTAVLGDSPPITPELTEEPDVIGDEATIAGVVSRLAAAAAVEPTASKSLKPTLKPSLRAGGHSRNLSLPGLLPGPLKSIVEDLKDKTRLATPAARSPTTEASNPFSKLTRFAADPVPSPKPTHGRKHQTTHPDSQATPRLRRRQSRSLSRRAASVGPTSPDRGPLPQPWHIEPNPHCNGGLKNAVDSVSHRMKKKVWVGTLGTNTDSFGDELRKDINAKMGAERECLPVWIPDAEFQSCYDEFCHQVLWPCLHYAVPDAPKTKLFYESASYKQYVAVNQRFADRIIENYQEGDIIWVNDYHLLLLPTLLRLSPKIPPNAPIGFFMHVAFPSSEIFRCLSVRKDLLRGMLGADLVGFQTANYARHWRQTVSRIMSYEALPRGIQIPEGDGLTVEETQAGEKGSNSVRDGAVERGRFVDVGVFPMGIDVHQLSKKKHEPEVAEWVQVLRQRYAGMKLVVGRDKLDEIQGVKHKLTAFESFLVKYPEFQGKIVLIQVALQTTESNEIAAGGVTDIVSRINSKFSTLTYQPVVFLHTQDLTFSQYLALLTVADAFIVTSLREGMALRTHEFVECQEGSYRPLILSEFTGSYSFSGFRSCIAVNPWDTRSTANAIHQALTMSDEEARSRWEDLHNHVTTQTAQAFVTTFLNRCVRANTEHTSSLEDPSSTLSSAGTAVPLLKPSLLLPRYKHSTKRLILIDFEGTLWKRDLTRKGLLDLQKNTDLELRKKEGLSPEVALPKEVEDLIDVLRRLSDDRKNEVWLMSGLRVKGVLEAVADRVAKVGIVAENGCFLKTRSVGSFTGENNFAGEWISMVSNFNLTWKNSCLEILNYFTERTPGSFIEEREASMVWRFWTGESMDHPDRQWAQRQAAEAQNHIFDSLGERYGLRIIPGRNSFLVLPNNVSRSSAVGAILHPGGPARSPSHRGHPHQVPWMNNSMSDLPVRGGSRSFSTDDSAYGSLGGGSGSGSNIGGHDLDFLLAVSSDEKLLTRLNELDAAETVSTSGKGTDAKWRLSSEETLSVLRGLVQGTSVGP